MTWWEWLLVGIGGYIVVGLTIAGIEAYREGRTDSQSDGADQSHYTGEDEIFLFAFLWPVFICFDWIPTMYGKIYSRGKSSTARKLARQSKRNARKEFKALCKREGWPFRKMWQHQKAKTQT
jgi:hypothetical protein